MDPRHRNCERKRQKRLISTEWCQIDLFLQSSSTNMPYISIKINYPVPRIQGNPSLPGRTCQQPGRRYYLFLFLSNFCSPTFSLSLFFSGPLKHECVMLKQTHIHTLHTQSSPQQVLYSPRYQRGNYHARKSVPSPIIISLLHYPQNQCGCFPPIITDDTFHTAAIFTAVSITVPYAYCVDRFYGFS